MNDLLTKNTQYVLLKITGKNFTARGFMRKGILTHASMIIEFMEGWNIRQIKKYCQNEGWKIVFIL